MIREQRSKRTLLQHYTPVFAMISAIESNTDIGETEELALKTRRLLDEVRENAVRTGIQEQLVSDAQFAVVAFVDESIARSSWKGKENWLAKPLSSRYGMPANAGAVFFDRLDDWLKSPQPPKDLVEVFYVCLGLGFRGRLYDQPAELKRRKKDLFDILVKGQETLVLSPAAARPPDDQIGKFNEGFPWFWYIAALLGFLIILFVVFKVSSIAQMEELMQTLGTNL
jgi:type VI secretion system protein ImpK